MEPTIPPRSARVQPKGAVRLNNSDLLELVKKYVYVGMPVVILTSEADSAVPCRFPAAVEAGPRLMAQTE